MTTAPTIGRVFRGYRQVLGHIACRGYIVTNAAAFGALFAYVSGSSLFFIGALGWSRGAYSLVFAVTSCAIMAGALASGRLSSHGVGIEVLLGLGVSLAVASSVLLLLVLLCGWMWAPGLLLLIVAGTFGFGLIAPNATHAALQPLPNLAGTVSAVAGSLQVLVGAASSAFVVSVSGRPGLAMALAMVVCSLTAYLSCAGLHRHTRRYREATPDGTALPQAASPKCTGCNPT